MLNRRKKLQKEKDGLITATITPISTSKQPISTNEITKSMSHVSLKDAEILKLKEKKQQRN